MSSRQDLVITNNKLQKISKELRNVEFSSSPKAIKKELLAREEDLRNAKGTNARNEALDKFMKVYTKAMYIHELDNHVGVAGTVEEIYRPMVIEMTNQIIFDFECITAHEKALAGVIASSYGRYLQYSSKFALAQQTDSMGKEKTQYYTMFSKEADKAHRQFTNALTTLQQLKSPTPKINVKTNAAFVAQYQQNNAAKTL